MFVVSPVVEKGDENGSFKEKLGKRNRKAIMGLALVLCYTSRHSELWKKLKCEVKSYSHTIYFQYIFFSNVGIGIE